MALNSETDLPYGLSDAEMARWFQERPCPAPFGTVPSQQMAPRASRREVKWPSTAAGRPTTTEAPMSSHLLIAMYGQAAAAPTPTRPFSATRSGRPFAVTAPFAQHGTDLPDELPAEPMAVRSPPQRISAPYATWSGDALVETRFRISNQRPPFVSEGRPVAGSHATPPREFCEPMRNDLTWMMAGGERNASRRGGSESPRRAAHESQLRFGENA